MIKGEFDFVEGTTKGGVSIRVFSPPGRAEQGLFALDVGIRSLDFYDSFFKAKIYILLPVYMTFLQIYLLIYLK